MTLIQEPDYGTPARAGEATVDVEIDGRPSACPRARR